MNLALVPQCFKNWQVQPANKEQLKRADCIVGFSFGLREKNEPGLSNHFLAKVITHLHHSYPEAEIMVQWEIASCLPFKLPDYRIVSKHRKAGEYLDTEEVASQMIDLLRDPHTRPIVVAHPLHMWRCIKVMEKKGFQKVFAADTTSVRCDPESIQSWTRSNFRFATRELPARLLYLKKDFI